ncbi:hypothetical protein GTP38_03085 [Duganella sp. FT94W]|uniref:Transcriptional regulator n=1 Tax=Duganella lactea TaxID=2692173 RepID=A0ABW9V3F8_9BURK|nr:hypothetical protein [Duganella lactea]
MKCGDYIWRDGRGSPRRLLDGMEGKLTSAKCAAIGKCWPDTSLLDINDRLTQGLLRKTNAGGRSTGYELTHRGTP